MKFLRVLIVLSIITFPNEIDSIKLPDLWIKYLAWIDGYFNEFQSNIIGGLPQIIYPNQAMLNHAHDDVNGPDLQQAMCCLPPILMWNPLTQYPFFFHNGMNCPVCGNKLSFRKRNVCQDKSSQPRILQDFDSIVLLIGCVYTCSNRHILLSYDARLLASFPTQDEIPFTLAHKTGFTKRLLNMIYAHVEQGQDFMKTMATILSCRSKFLKHKGGDNCLIPSEFKIPQISRFTITSVFLKYFFNDKEKQLIDDMRRVSSNGWISLDHTFKVASNIGFLRSDHKWVTQYRSVFIVMNELGLVMSWQFTTSESTAEVQKLLKALYYRSQQQNMPIHSIIIDNCCQWRSFLQGIFGLDINVKLDVFHGVQRITRTLSKKDRYYKELINELRMVFRRKGDVGVKRVLSTPETEVILQNIEIFIARWMKIIDMRNSTLKELYNIKRHASCLSNIPPGIGTNRNEVLHKYINPYFTTARVGVQVAYALLFLLLWMHNNKTTISKECSSFTTSMTSSRQRTIDHDHNYQEIEHFGVLPKANSHSGFWGINPIMSFDEAIENAMLNEVEGYSNTLVTIEDAKIIVQYILSTVKMIEAGNSLFCHSPILGKHYLSLLGIDNNVGVISAVQSDEGELHGYEQHEHRLNCLLHTCGLIKVNVSKDGNCCFTSIALALKNLNQNSHVNSDLHYSLSTAQLPVNIQASIEEMSSQLRQLVYREWIAYQHEYEDYITSEGNFQEEAEKFLINGFFFADLGDTVVKALSNALSIPIIVLTSVSSTPVLHFKPRKFMLHAPLVIAYNQFGAGHYDSVSYTSTIATHSGCHTAESANNWYCKCGMNDKNGLSATRCCPNNPLYVSRCPCLKLHRQCSLQCKCKGCNNPYGTKPTDNVVKLKRRRGAHQLQITHLNNTEFLKKSSEKVSKGKWTVFELVLLRRARAFATQAEGTESVEVVHKVYNEVIEFVHKKHMDIPVGEKSMAAIIYQANQQKKTEEGLRNLLSILP